VIASSSSSFPLSSSNSLLSANMFSLKTSLAKTSLQISSAKKSSAQMSSSAKLSLRISETSFHLFWLALFFHYYILEASESFCNSLALAYFSDSFHKEKKYLVDFFSSSIYLAFDLTCHFLERDVRLSCICIFVYSARRL
ncbi:17460_t:CDS:2, partial [Dentiscutata erythropus]